jgi:PKD repeat protein
VTRQGSRFDAQRRSASRHPGVFPGRRFALALVLAAGLMRCSAAAAALNPSLSVQATIHQRSGAVVTDSVSLAALAQNPGQCPNYPGPYSIDLHNAGGGVSTDTIGNPKQAWSLATVLGCLTPTPIPPSSVNGVTVVQSNGVPELSQFSQLGPGDLSASVVYTDGTNIVYDRPWRGGGDDNAIDQVREASPLVIDVYQGAQIFVTATASQTTVASGATVNFSATVPPGDSAGISYSWNFGGGAQGAQTSSLAAPSVTFGSPGKYIVGLQVANSAGGGGGAQITITVTGAVPTSTSPTTPTTGPTRSAGHTPGTQPGTSTNQNSGTPGNGQAPGSGNGTSGVPTPASGGTSSGSGASGSGSASAGTVTASRHGKSARRRRSQTAPANRRSTTVSGPLTIVTGRLIGAVTPLAAGASPLVHGAGPLGTAPPMRRAISASILPGVAAGLGVFLLFSLGAGRELRWGRSLRVLLFG